MSTAANAVPASDYWAQASAVWNTTGAGNAVTLLGAIATFVVAWLALRFSRQEAILRDHSEHRRAVLVAAQVASILDLATNHLRSFGQAILFASWANFAESERMAKDMFSRLEPIGLEVALRLAPLGDECGLRLIRGFASIARARRLLEDSLPSGGVDGILIPIPWDESRDELFKKLLGDALTDLETAREICTGAVSAVSGINVDDGPP